MLSFFSCCFPASAPETPDRARALDPSTFSPTRTSTGASSIHDSTKSSCDLQDSEVPASPLAERSEATGLRGGEHAAVDSPVGLGILAVGVMLAAFGGEHVSPAQNGPKHRAMGDRPALKQRDGPSAAPEGGAQAAGGPAPPRPSIERPAPVQFKPAPSPLLYVARRSSPLASPVRTPGGSTASIERPRTADSGCPCQHTEASTIAQAYMAQSAPGSPHSRRGTADGSIPKVPSLLELSGEIRASGGDFGMGTRPASVLMSLMNGDVPGLAGPEDGSEDGINRPFKVRPEGAVWEAELRAPKALNRQSGSSDQSSLWRRLMI